MPKRKRHVWNRKGPWNGSKDVRVCLLCRVSVFKTGLYSGYDVTWPGEAPRWYARMPECRGKEPDR